MPLPPQVKVQGIKFPVGLSPAHQQVGGAIAGKVPEIDKKDFSFGAGQGIIGSPTAIGFIQNLQINQRLILYGVKDNGLVLLIAIQIGKNIGGTIVAAGRVAQPQLLANNVPQGFIHFGLQLGKDRGSQEGIHIGLVKIAAGKAQQKAGAQSQSAKELFRGDSSFLWGTNPQSTTIYCSLFPAACQ